tara:strand:+ start:298 stop:1785 length:1488 start_codon:yes stop_codon:yes gene_type:complete
MKYIIFICNIIFLTAYIKAGNIRVINRVDETTNNLETLETINGHFISIEDISKILSNRAPFINNDREKVVLYVRDSRIKISANSSFILVDDKVFQLPAFCIWINGDLYVTAASFFEIIKKTILPGISFNKDSLTLELNIKEFTINNINISQKANGTILRIKTSQSFPDGNISSFFHENGWFYITVANGLVDTTEIRKSDPKGVVKKIVADQLGNTAQIAFQMRTKVESHDLYQSKDPSEIVLSLRTAITDDISRISKVRDRWKIDTIVLDAGHGGKDPGTMSKNGLMEKNIVLDIVKRIGLSLEKNTKMNVIYTREEDVFVPLWMRTKIANETNGKMFISVHANHSHNKSAYGFETYLLRPGKTQDAIEVASRENEVIKFEDRSNEKYKDLSGESLIMATMAQSMFMKESEELASIIQQEMGKTVKSKNRGVKQAGFQVLIGASMPNVLIEVGFVSNANEERNLKNPKHRQDIAYSIYKAIVKFRYSREQYLSEN